MRDLIYRVIDRSFRACSYFRVFPFFQALRILFLEFFRMRRVVSVRCRGVAIRMRTCSSDYSVTYSCLVENEYAPVRLNAPAFIIDGGANIGTSAIAFARRFPGAKVLAVEMDSENFELLKENTSAFPNVVCIRAALSEANGVVPVFDRKTGPWGYTIVGGLGNAVKTSQIVESVTIDKLMADHGIERLDLVKLDVEGAEKTILEHAGDWLSRTTVLCAELHDRIAPGCERAFFLATRDFSSVERLGEKVVAYR